MKLAEVWAFIPSYQSALLVNDLITAVLLFAQFVILAPRALLVLAGGYLFTALMAVPHALSFPRLFAPDGLIGAGPQTTAWLYMFWHAGFPLAVIGFALLRDGARDAAARPSPSPCLRRSSWRRSARRTLLATSGHDLLPAIMRGDGYTPVLPVVTVGVWSLSLAALFMLWRRRPHSVLDVWLMVVMVAWLFDIALGAVLMPDGSILASMSGAYLRPAGASLVLLVLLIETGAVYARLARSYEAERNDRDRQLHELQAELIHVSRLTELGQMVSALAHEVNQPLTAVGSYLRAGLAWLQAGGPRSGGRSLHKAVEQVTRASQVIQRLRHFVKKDDGPSVSRTSRRTIEEAAALACWAPRRAGCA